MKIENLSLNLGELVFFKDLSFELKRGVLHTLSGKNGSGKSTLFAALKGDIPTTGTIDTQGDTVLISQRYDEMIADQFSFTDNLKFAQFSYLPSFLRGLKPSLYLPPFIERFGIPYDKPAKLLSGGQRQILAVLMALQKKPSVLLLDEPTATLDPVNGQMVFQFLTELIQENGLTALVICHDHELVSRFRTGSSMTLEVEESGLRRLVIHDSCSTVLRKM